MHKKIFRSLLALVFVILILVSALLAGVLYRQASRGCVDALRSKAHFLAAFLDEKSGVYEHLPELAERVTLLAADGTVLLDTAGGSGEMDNHRLREEFRQALAAGEGVSFHQSSVFGSEYVYYALKLADGSVLRLSCPNQVWRGQLAELLLYLAAIMLAALAAAFFLARSITAKVLRPLEQLDWQHPERGWEQAYPELLPVLDRFVKERNKSERLRREFSANVTHELKTPLQSVLGYSEIMLGGLARPEDSRRFLQKIYGEAKNLLQLIDDIIRLSRLDDFHKDDFEIFSLQEAARRAAARVQPLAERRGISLLLQLPEQEYRLSGVPQLLQEVLANLLENAVKYNYEGGSVTLSLRQEEGAYVLTVADTGIGIAPKEQKRIFERFYRVDKSRRKQVEGTGLGLSIVKHGVQLHDGSITVKSALQEGSEFIIRLPKNVL